MGLRYRESGAVLERVQSGYSSGQFSPSKGLRCAFTESELRVNTSHPA